jgi:hypothetical protein
MVDAPRPFARDLDLVREILLWMEAGAPREQRPAVGDDRKYYLHIQIMVDAGLIEAAIAGKYEGCMAIPGSAIPRKITMRGYDVLESMRNDTVWTATKTKLAEHGLPLLFEFAGGVARGFAAKYGIPFA